MCFDPQKCDIFHSKLLLDNSASFHIINDERLVSKMEGKLIFRGIYRLSGTGIVAYLEIIDVPCNLKQFDVLQNAHHTLRPSTTTCGAVQRAEPEATERSRAKSGAASNLEQSMSGETIH